MIKEYYIIENDAARGPYDVVMLVRKLRNGTLTSETPLSAGTDAERKPAGEWPELSDFFKDKEERTDSAKHAQLQNRGLIMTLANGWHFLQHNQICTIFSGLLVLASILLMGLTYIYLPRSLVTLGYMFSFAASYFLLSCYFLCILRMTRGQPLDSFYFKDKILPVAGRLMACSGIITLPALLGIALLTGPDSAILSILGLIIFAVPGLLMLTVFTYTPLLILDQNYSIRDAMKISLDVVMKSGVENIGVLFALYAINFIGGMLALLPLAITLPITVSPITEIYDEFFA